MRIPLRNFVLYLDVEKITVIFINNNYARVIIDNN